jgi:superfamily I DNA/RNA helicase
MSKICEGTILTPMKGADLIKQQTTEAAKTDSRYLPPWMRKAVLDEKKKNGLTAEEVASTELFPTLKPMQPCTNTNATWSQIGSRLAQPISLKKVVEDSIEREQKLIEEGIRQQQETDPFKMTEQQLEERGWKRIRALKNREDFRRVVNNIHERARTHKEYLESSGWDYLPVSDSC